MFNKKIFCRMFVYSIETYLQKHFIFHCWLRWLKKIKCQIGKLMNVKNISLLRYEW
jgi:hypothetical protein